MNPALWALALAATIFAGIIASLEVGYRLGRRSSDAGKPVNDGVGSMETAVFALLGLLLGFSFSGGMDRLGARRQMIVQEANAIGTAYLRLDLLAAADQPNLRRHFRDYIDARLEVYRNTADIDFTNRALERAAKIQERIWPEAVAASRADATQTASRLLLPAINDMIDITSARTVAMHTHQPALIFLMLSGLTLLSGFVAGFAMASRGRRSWPHVVIYAFVVALTVYAIVDLDNPRHGLIRLDAADSLMTKLRDSIR